MWQELMNPQTKPAVLLQTTAWRHETPADELSRAFNTAEADAES